jgi:hypothetical protein
MTREQVVILLLLAVAFAAGWIARGAQDSDQEPVDLGEDRTDVALARALTAYRAARSMWAAENGPAGPAGRMAVEILRARVEQAHVAAEAGDDPEARRESLAVVALLERAVGSLEASLQGFPLDRARLHALDAVANRSIRASRTGPTSMRAAGALGR